MDKLIDDLLAIEATATQGLTSLDDEQTAMAQHIVDEISRRNLEIQRKADKAIQAQKQEAEDNTQATLEEIETQFQQNVASLKQHFDDNINTWRKYWATRVLEGTS